MPYKITVNDVAGIIQTELIDNFSKEDISAYIKDLLTLDVYHRYGRLLVDYSRAADISGDFKEFSLLTDKMAPLQILGGEIWQAGINADPVFKGISRQVNTLLELKNPHVDRVNLRFFDNRQDALSWLSLKPVN